MNMFGLVISKEAAILQRMAIVTNAEIAAEERGYKTALASIQKEYKELKNKLKCLHEQEVTQ